MLTARELWRVLRDVVVFSLSSGRIWLLIAVLCVALLSAVSGAVTVVGPVAVYPFL